MDLQKDIDYMAGCAKQCRLEYDEVAPVAFIRAKFGCTVFPLHEFSSSRETAYGKLGFVAAMSNAQRVIVVSDAALRKADSEEMEYVGKNLDTESPLTYPEGHPCRTECIALMVVDIERQKSLTVLYPYHRTEEGFEFDVDKEETLEGGKGMFVEAFTVGYNIAADKINDLHRDRNFRGLTAGGSAFSEDLT